MRLSALPLACATALLVAISAVPAAPQQRQMGGIGITVYEQPNFRGRNATYRDDVRNLNDTGMNDRINSLEVAPGEMWEVCEDRDFRGRCQVFSGTEYDLRARGWGDQISSLRRVRGGGGEWGGGGGGGARGLALYAGRNFTGDVRWFQGPVSNLRQVGFDNTAMSLRLPEGEVWEVCDEAFFRRIHNKVYIGACTDDQFDWILVRVAERKRIEVDAAAAARLRQAAKARGDGELRAYLPGVICQLADAVISYENLGRQLTPTMVDRVLDLYFTRMEDPAPAPTVAEMSEPQRSPAADAATSPTPPPAPPMGPVPPVPADSPLAGSPAG